MSEYKFQRLSDKRLEAMARYGVLKDAANEALARGEDVKRLEAEIKRLRETNRDLNRRATKAEGIIAQSGILENRPQGATGRSLGRALANYAAERAEDDVKRLEGEIEQLQWLLQWALAELEGRTVCPTRNMTGFTCDICGCDNSHDESCVISHLNAALEGKN